MCQRQEKEEEKQLKINEAECGGHFLSIYLLADTSHKKAIREYFNNEINGKCK